jgi:DNA-binding response OmpR family regulator
MNESLVILHVDDDESCLRLSRSSFERALSDVEVVTRTDPDEALATLGVESVDAVVSDSVDLADGTPFVEAARNAYPDLPIVLYTGREFTDAAPVITRAGVSEYVQKRASTTVQDLVGRVERLVDEAGSRSSADRFRYTPPNRDDDSTGETTPSDTVATDEWTELARCDPTSVDDLVVTLVDVLGDRADERPLVELFDAEALARVFESPADDDARVQIHLRLDTHEVVITADGVVASRPSTPA